MKSLIATAAALCLLPAFANAAPVIGNVLKCETKYTWPKGNDDLNYDNLPKEAVKLKLNDDKTALIADIDQTTSNGRFNVHITAMSPTKAAGIIGGSFIRIGAMDKKTNTYSTGNEVFISSLKAPYNRAHLQISPEIVPNEPGNGLMIDCTLE